jgi:hypothetical protein
VDPCGPVEPVGPVGPVDPVVPCGPINPVFAPIHWPLELITAVDPTVNPFLTMKFELAKVHFPLSLKKY